MRTSFDQMIGLPDFQIPPKYYFECKAINVFLLPFLNACTQMDIIKTIMLFHVNAIIFFLIMSRPFELR